MSTTTLTKQDRQPVASSQPTPVQHIVPVVDLHQQGDGYLLEVELPGVNKAGLELTIEDGKLIIVGHRSQPAEGLRVIHRERPAANYRRVFDLDPTIDPEQVRAGLEQGLLRIHLRKAAAHQPRKISVES
jgi:HSP20 family protein